MQTSTILKAVLLGGGLMGTSLVPARAADIIKSDNTDNLNLGTSWVGGVSPSPDDIAVWDNVILGENATALGGSLSWLGIRLADPGGLVTVLDSGNTLTLGAGGIDLGAATQDLLFGEGLALGAAQTWNVGPGRTLTMNGVVSGAAGIGLTKGGEGTLILGGTNTFVGGTTVSGGALQINFAAGGGTGPIRLAGGALVYNPAAGVNLANPMEIVADTTNLIVVTSGSGGNPISSGAWSGGGLVLVSNTYNPYTVNASMAAFSGTVLLVTPVGAQFRFNSGGGNPNTGSPDAIFDLGTGNGSLRSRNVGTIHLGALRGGPGTVLAGRSSGTGGSTIFSLGAKGLDTVFAGTIANGGDSTALTKVGPGKLTLTGANTYTGATTVNEGTLEIGDGGASGTLGTAAVVNNATLSFNRSDDFTMGNAISGSGTIIKDGFGIMTLTGPITSSGTTLVKEGTLLLESGSSISGPIEIASSAVLDVFFAFTTLTQPLAGDGTVAGLLTAGSNSTINPGGVGTAGTLTFASGLALTDGAVVRFDVSDDPTGTIKANDLVSVDGNLDILGPCSVVVAPLDGAVPPGTYRLFGYTGFLNGNLANVSVSGVTGTLVDQTNALAIVVASSRPPADLVWQGDNLANLWDENTSSNWLNGANPDKFLSFDRVRFDAAGAANPVVNLTGVLLPAAVEVDAATDYTFAGSGRISGSASLTKTNSGTLTIEGGHDFTGPTTIGGGTVVVSQIANGSAASGLGAATSDPTNLVFQGTTLRYLGPTASTDRGAMLAGAGATLDIATETNLLTISGSLVGEGVLTKIGPGTLTLASGNSFSGGTVIRQGTLALGSQAANHAAGLSGVGATNAPVTFEGGTLEMFGFDGANNVNYNTLYNPLVVPEGQTGTLRLFQRGPTDNTGLASPLSGGGTLNLVVSYLRGSLDGDWSAFSGQINVSVKEGVANGHCRINHPAGYAGTSVFVNDLLNLYRNGGANLTTDFGELAGTAGAVLGWGTVAQNQAAANPTWRVGAKNTSATFAGTIINDGVTSITKIGSGTWTLTGVNTYSGTTTISNGVLALSGDGSIGGSTNIDIAAGAILDVSGRTDATLTLNATQMLSGDGLLRGSVVAGAGSTVSPGAVEGTAVGRLTITNSLLLQDGSVVQMNWDRAAQTNDVIDGLATVTYGGELRIVGSFVGGESLKLFDAGSYQGFFTTITPVSPGVGLAWDDSDLYVNGTLRISGSTPIPVIGTVGLSGNSLTLSGTGGPSGGTYYLLTATNVSLPLAQWLPIATNTFAGDGSFSITQEVDPAAPRQFFVLQQAP